jgi:hypothetical protein
MGYSHFGVKSLVVNIIDHLLPSVARFNVQRLKLNIHSHSQCSSHTNYSHSYHILIYPGTAFECTRALSFKSYALTTILQRLSVMMVCMLFISRHRYHTHVAK